MCVIVKTNAPVSFNQKRVDRIVAAALQLTNITRTDYGDWRVAFKPCVVNYACHAAGLPLMLASKMRQHIEDMACYEASRSDAIATARAMIRDITFLTNAPLSLAGEEHVAHCRSAAITPRIDMRQRFQLALDKHIVS